MRRIIRAAVAAGAVFALAPVTAAAQADPGVAAIQAKYAELGGGGPLGDWYELHDGGRVARFAKWGTTVAITWSPAYGAHWFSGAINAKWTPNLGVAVADQTPTEGRPGAAAAFANGVSIYYSDTTGAHALSGRIRTVYWYLGNTSGQFGFPITDVRSVTGGVAADFEGQNTIFDDGGRPPGWISGALRQKFYDAGGAERFTFPLGFQTRHVGRPGYSVALQGNLSIYWSPGTGATLLDLREINEKYQSTGGPAGMFGYPITDTHAIPGGSRALFQGTVQVMWSPETGAHWISGALADLLWNGLGGTQELGLPTSDQVPTYGANGLYSLFGPNVAIIWGPTTGAALVSDDFLARLRADGDVADYGLPETKVLDLAGREGWTFQQFQHASIFQTEQTVRTVGWHIRSVWWSAGGYGGVLGLPTGDERDLGDRAEQTFEGGVVGCYYQQSTCYYGPVAGDKVHLAKPGVRARR